MYVNIPYMEHMGIEISSMLFYIVRKNRCKNLRAFKGIKLFKRDAGSCLLRISPQYLDSTTWIHLGDVFYFFQVSQANPSKGIVKLSAFGGIKVDANVW